MKILPPIEGFKLASYPKGSVTQWFGENPDLYNHPRMRNRMLGHNGIDIVAPHGTPIFAVEGGRVVNIKEDTSDGYGKHVRIETKKEKDGISRVWVYGHLDRIDVKLKQELVAGEQLGTMGNTGFVISAPVTGYGLNPFAGTHLHLGVRNKKNDTVLDYDNGYFGYYNFSHFYEGHETNDYKAKQLLVISLLNKVISLYKELLKK
jgi:murein DD-endopeptidase MepM/ murein hydrolase activator NlpD